MSEVQVDNGVNVAALLDARAALTDARRNLLEQVYGVELKSKTTVKDFVTESDVIKTRVSAFMRGCYPVETKYLDDGSVEVTVAINLRGLRSVIPTERGRYIEILE